MMGWQHAAIAALSVLVASCAGTGGKYPEYQTLNVAVSSGWGTLPDADHDIPNSQVSIGGRSGGQGVGGYFGGLGLAIGTAVDAARNEGDLQGAGSAFALKFDRIVIDELRKRAGDGRPDYRITRRDAEETQMLLFPSARFVTRGEELPMLILSIEARFGERTKTSFDERRDYVYVPGESRRFVGASGWTQDGGAAFKAITTRAFQRLAAAFSDDVRGVHKTRREAPNAPRIRWKSAAMKNAASAVVLRDEPDYLVVAPATHEAVSDRVLLIERSLVVP